ncbi:hypothetical protein AO1008_03803 [Aspergillus oryzae 100-8]|uniref:Uncharacterized protein n=1 Tax=Aspergillus oryzae (strain 3.042) TaxID=1160506 RepID=I8TNQ8_ASPO3|nr:hypothetical protein Ao3042_08341 [Aspergillus oryzae 3.042]KDE86106.1 hypothetical protein AO1008_03803 [Aspergillus oryzae 100-8]|eukprot:EIT75568.1 hypothetical protein Ao3042_08341 [Aspergillus oryzae 3.042]
MRILPPATIITMSKGTPLSSDCICLSDGRSSGKAWESDRTLTNRGCVFGRRKAWMKADGAKSGSTVHKEASEEAIEQAGGEYAGGGLEVSSRTWSFSCSCPSFSSAIFLSRQLSGKDSNLEVAQALLLKDKVCQVNRKQEKQRVMKSTAWVRHLSLNIRATAIDYSLIASWPETEMLYSWNSTTIFKM